jgi:hypothetical protein
MKHDQYYAEVHEAQDLPPEGSPSHGWIQWKGTNVCMDIYCSCGHHSHVDTEFLYNFRCAKCKQAFAVGAHVRLIPLTPAQEAYVETDGGGFKTDPLEEAPTQTFAPKLSLEKQMEVDSLKARITNGLGDGLKAFVGEKVTPAILQQAKTIATRLLTEFLPESKLARVEVVVTTASDDPSMLRVQVLGLDGKPVTDAFLAEE